MIHGMHGHKEHHAPLGGGNLIITILSIPSSPGHQEHLQGNPDMALPKPLEMLLSCFQLLQHVSSKQGLIPGWAELRRAHFPGRNEARRVPRWLWPTPEDALPHAQGGQRSSRHQREGSCMILTLQGPPPMCHRGFWVVLVSQCVTSIVHGDMDIGQLVLEGSSPLPVLWVG